MENEECVHKWVFVNGVKVCELCCQEYDDSMDIDDSVFTDTHVFMNLVNGGGLVMSGGWNKYNISSYGKAIQHVCNLNNHNYISRLLYMSTLKIEEIVNKYMLSIELIQATINYFKTILDIKNNLSSVSKRYNIMQLLSSCFFYASKSLNLSLNHKNVAEMFGLTEKHVAKGIKIFNSYMQNQSVITMTKSITIDNLFNILDIFLEKLSIDDEFFCKYCKEIIQKIYDNNIFFKYSHDRIVATVIYYVGKIHNKNITTQTIHDISNMSIQSILKSYNTLLGYNKFLIN